MCGIGGILRSMDSSASPPKPGIPADWVDAMSACIAHRGPDGRGTFTDRIRSSTGQILDVLLVHHRLAVIDPAAGHQPMVASSKLDPAWTEQHAASPLPPAPPASADDLLAVVFNGCIYNHRALRQQLAAAGAGFRTDHSDTEAILHGFRAWNTSVASHLEGMFAFALWDRRHGRLVLARDRPGEKPLYTASFELPQDPHGPSRCLAFASTVPALVRLIHAATGDTPAVDPHSIARWLRFGFDASVPLEGITALAPGHIAVAEGSFTNVTSRPYFTLPAQRDPNRAITLDELDRVLARAVAERLESDVPLGCFLSGGIDSSLVAAYAAKARPGLNTYCVRMPDPRYDESAHARSVARRLGTKHATLEVSPRPAEDLARLIEGLGLPFGDSSLLPTHWVAAAARRHVTVALSGDGGDELFMGYDRYKAASLLRDYGPLLRVLPTRPLERFHPRSKPHKLGRFAVAAAHAGYEELLSIFPTPDLARIAPALDPASTLRLPPGTRITDPARYDVASYLPDDLLRKVDTASMAVALEVRAPLLATAVMELGLSLPASTLTANGPKSLLRMVARRYMPDEIVSRPKSGFAIPIGEWIRSNHGKLGDLVRGTCESVTAFDGLGIDLDRKAIKAMAAEHAASRRDHSQRLYLLTVLGLWNRWLRAMR